MHRAIADRCHTVSPAAPTRGSDRATSLPPCHCLAQLPATAPNRTATAPRLPDASAPVAPPQTPERPARASSRAASAGSSPQAPAVTRAPQWPTISPGHSGLTRLPAPPCFTPRLVRPRPPATALKPATCSSESSAASIAIPFRSLFRCLCGQRFNRANRLHQFRRHVMTAAQIGR